MKVCKRCGAEVVDSMNFCPNCGAPMHETENDVKYAEFSQEDQQRASGANTTKNRWMGILSYLSWLVLIPLIGSKVPFVRFHVKQGLRLLAAETGLGVLHYLLLWGLRALFRYPYYLPPAAHFIMIPIYLGELGFVVLAVIGIVNVLLGRERPLPYIGTFRFKRS